jgi:hypothetical protein
MRFVNISDCKINGHGSFPLTPKDQKWKRAGREWSKAPHKEMKEQMRELLKGRPGRSMCGRRQRSDVGTDSLNFSAKQKLLQGAGKHGTMDFGVVGF